MSYMQPLITSAFSTFAVSRGAYVDRAEIASKIERQIENNNAIATENAAAKNAEDPRDAGKPRSESGDILDLSDRVSVDAAQKTDTPEQTQSVDAVPSSENAVPEADVAAPSAADESAADSIELKAESAGDAETEAAVAEELGTQSDAALDLTPEEQEQVEELKARDAEVKVHEAAHLAAAGAYATGGPSYTYQTGPDGQKYAIGGEVGIDTGEVSGDPEATIQKMQTVYRAAMAPAEPSGQDYKVAAAACQKEAQARAELAQQNADTMSADASTGGEEAESESTAATVSTNATTVNDPASSTETSADRSVADQGVADGFAARVAEKSAEKSDDVSKNSSVFDADAAPSAQKSSARSTAYQAQSIMPLNTALNTSAAVRFTAFA